MKLGCGTVLFRQYELEKALYAIREIGFEYFESQAVGPWCPHVDVDKDDPIHLAELKDKYGFSGISGLWCQNGNFIANPNCVSSGIRCVEWASAAGIPVLHMGDGHKPAEMSDEDAWKALRENLAPVFEVAKKCGVTLAIEPHGAYSLTGEGLKKLLTLGTPDILGVNYDACNMFRAGYVESNNGVSGYKETKGGNDELAILKEVSDRVVHCHAKDIDAKGNCIAVGTGLVNVKGCVEHLKSIGYNGVVSVETEGEDDFDTTVKIAKQSYDFLNSIINA